MDLSVLIATYNRMAHLKQALDSLSGQEGAEQILWEVIIVDNNSTDGTRDFVREYAKGCSLNLRYYFEPSQGKSYALNAGIKEAKGQVIAITDDDVVVDKNWISSIWQACNRYSNLCFGGKILPLWPQDIPSWITTEGPYRLVGGAIISHDWGNSVCPYDRQMYAPLGANLFIRRKAFEEFGEFNTELGPKGLRSETQGYMEDSELCFRLMRAGEQCLYIPAALVYHPVPAERLKKSYFLRWYFGSGKALVRMEGMCNNSVKLMGVPRYLFRSLAEHAIQWWLAFDPKRRFFKKLQTYHVLGQIAQCFLNTRKSNIAIQ